MKPLMPTLDSTVHVLAVLQAARLLSSIAGHIGDTAKRARYEKESEGLVANLQRHWSASHKAFCDIGLPSNEEGAAVGLVCHPGYVTLFPFLLRLLPADSPQLGDVLAMVGDPLQLWSPYGIRSLSKADSKFGTGEDYWRGAVWINCNFLALQVTTVGPSDQWSARDSVCLLPCVRT